MRGEGLLKERRAGVEEKGKYMKGGEVEEEKKRREEERTTVL